MRSTILDAERGAIATSFGYFLTKADLFGAAAAKGAVQVLLNVFLPALLFSKIVPGFTADKIAALGPLILVAFIYQLYGLAIAWGIRKIFWVPRRFQYGIIAAGIWSNWVDLPTAVVMSMTASAPFSAGDTDVAVAYVSAFVLVFFVTLFGLGGYRVIKMDYPDGAMPASTEDDPESPAFHACLRFKKLCLAMRGAMANPDVERALNIEGSPAIDERSSKVASIPQSLIRHSEPSARPEASTHAYGKPEGDLTCPETATPASPALTAIQNSVPGVQQSPKYSEPSANATQSTLSSANSEPSRIRCISLSARDFIVLLASPVTVTLIVSFVVALVPTLKALFILPPQDSNERANIGTAPDGLPPLNIIIDTAAFIGNGSIPLGLVCLGSALARMQVVRPISRAPLSAIATFAVFKMVVGPIFGVLVVEALTHRTRLIDPNDKVLRFVCMFFSGMPTATSQVILTRLYSPDGSASDISSFLIPQYALMFITMTALSAYLLSILF